MIRQLVLCGSAAAALAASVSGAEAFHVATDGNDANPGTKEEPFATLVQARDAVRARRAAGTLGAGPITVVVHGGTYRVAEPLTLTQEDSGAEGAPFVFQAAPGEDVRVLGGVRLTDWRPVTDPAVVRRLAPEARDNVLQADLKALGITNDGAVSPGRKRAELFFNQRYMTLARYPNDAFVRVADVPEWAGHRRPVSDPKRPDLNRHEGPFLFSGDRPERWAEAEAVWIHGYWFHDWSDQHHEVLKFDLAKKELWPKPPYHGYGYKKGQRFYYLNILEELDQPGEWFLDRGRGVLYFWPPSPIAGAEVTFPELEMPMITLEDVSHVHIRGITFECSRSSAIAVKGGTRNEITGCVVRNVGSVAISVLEGTQHTVSSCDVYEVGAEGVHVRGGDRETLAPAGHVVQNCHIHDFAKVFKTYRPGVRLQGVGNRLSHSYIHDCPHQAIGYDGNDHVIEYCDFTRVARETGDVGVTYAAMDWASMGHVFRHNYFHDIHGPGKLGCFTIYPDLPCGGIHLYGNVFYDIDQGFLTNSGRGMLIENNIFLRCRRGTLQFNVWMDMKKFQEGGNWRMVERIREIGYDKPPYSTRYPVLARLAEDFAKGPEHVLERALPKDNVVRRNISQGSHFLRLGAHASLDHVRLEKNLICDDIVFSGSPTGDGEARTYRNGDETIRAILAGSGNVVLDGDPGVIAPEAGDFRLSPDSPALALGFEPIPFDEIGLYVDEYRRALPAPEPTIATPSGLFIGRTEVRISPSRRGTPAEVRYTLNGSEPTPESTLYRAPIALTETTTVRCAAFPVGGPARCRSRTVAATFRAGVLGPGHGIHLSDLAELEYVGYGPLGFMKDKAYGGRGISLGGKTYPKGLITHPAETDAGGKAHVTYAIDGGLAKAQRFTARIGIEDQAPEDLGSCTFVVEIRREGTWQRVFESQVIRSTDPPQDVDVDISGADRLRLTAGDGGDNISWDHGVWADAMLR